MSIRLTLGIKDKKRKESVPRHCGTDSFLVPYSLEGSSWGDYIFTGDNAMAMMAPQWKRVPRMTWMCQMPW